MSYMGEIEKHKRNIHLHGTRDTTSKAKLPSAGNPAAENTDASRIKDGSLSHICQGIDSKLMTPSLAANYKFSVKMETLTPRVNDECADEISRWPAVKSEAAFLTAVSKYGNGTHWTTHEEDVTTRLYSSWVGVSQEGARFNMEIILTKPTLQDGSHTSSSSCSSWNKRVDAIGEPNTPGVGAVSCPLPLQTGMVSSSTISTSKNAKSSIIEEHSNQTFCEGGASLCVHPRHPRFENSETLLGVTTVELVALRCTCVYSTLWETFLEVSTQAKEYIETIEGFKLPQNSGPTSLRIGSNEKWQLPGGPSSPKAYFPGSANVYLSSQEDGTSPSAVYWKFTITNGESRDAKTAGTMMDALAPGNSKRATPMPKRDDTLQGVSYDDSYLRFIANTRSIIDREDGKPKMGLQTTAFQTAATQNMSPREYVDREGVTKSTIDISISSGSLHIIIV